MWRRPDGRFNLGAGVFKADIEPCQRLGGQALAFVEQAEQEVLGTDEIVVEDARLLLGEDQDAPGSVNETLEHQLLASRRHIGCRAVCGLGHA